MKIRGLPTFLFWAIVFFVVSIPLGLIVYFKKQLPSIWKKHMATNKKKKEREQQLIDAYKRVLEKSKQETKLKDVSSESEETDWSNVCVFHENKGGGCWN